MRARGFEYGFSVCGGDGGCQLGEREGVDVFDVFELEFLGGAEGAGWGANGGREDVRWG